MATSSIRPRPRAAAPVAPGRVRLSSEQRQTGIVSAVLALARERGPDAITTQAIADRIGVTQGAIFRHFADKEAIWLAVFSWVRQSLGEVLDEAIGAGRTPLDRIERAFFAHVGFVAANPGVPRVLFHELQYPGNSPVRNEVRAMILAYRDRLGRLFREARTAGELPRTLDPNLATIVLIGAVQSLMIQASIAGRDDDMESAARKLFPLLLDGYRGGKSK
jgi:AcrR family transcriptional regulator